jgi:hypothetical protein
MKAIMRGKKELWSQELPVYVENTETLRDELEAAPKVAMEGLEEVPHAEPGALQAVKSSIKGHGEQTILPDDCEFGDNDLCYVEA